MPAHWGEGGKSHPCARSGWSIPAPARAPSLVPWQEHLDGAPLAGNNKMFPLAIHSLSLLLSFSSLPRCRPSLTSTRPQEVQGVELSAALPYPPCLRTRMPPGKVGHLHLHKQTMHYNYGSKVLL